MGKCKIPYQTFWKNQYKIQSKLVITAIFIVTKALYRDIFRSLEKHFIVITIIYNDFSLLRRPLRCHYNKLRLYAKMLFLFCCVISAHLHVSFLETAILPLRDFRTLWILRPSYATGSLGVRYKRSTPSDLCRKGIQCQDSNNNGEQRFAMTMQ